MNVRVVGQQFTWTFYYRDGGKPVASPQLYVPQGRPVQVHGPVARRAARLLGPRVPP